jgi:hypothetical protein
MGEPTVWAVLVLTLPSRPNAVRLRIWRALKALGAASLRDGVYVLPAEREALFEPLAAQACEAGGGASILHLLPRDAAQRADVQALFDRTPAYADWGRSVAEAISGLPQLNETDARRRLRAIADDLQEIRRIDYYPAAAAGQADDELRRLRAEIDCRFSPGEPATTATHGIARLDARRFQRRRWATRARPWVDRLASAWLIRRFIDRAATFAWLADTTKVPRGAIGFDFDGARFSHVGARVTFEVIAASFGLDDDPRLQKIGQAVRYLDVGGIPVAEAAGLELVLAGLRETHHDDDRLVKAAATVFDALYAAPVARA